MSDKHPQTRRKYTSEEKKQLLDNLDLEVAHRASQFERWLVGALEAFKSHQEGVISRVPRLVRNVTMRELAKYNGDVQACNKGLQREKLGGEVEAIDKTTRKRKWVESQEPESKMAEAGSTKGTKSARITNPATPRKGPAPFNAPGTGQRARIPTLKTPGTMRAAQRMPLRAPSPSPFKATHTTKPPAFPRPPSRPLSPSKLPSPTKPKSTRPPSSTQFNPAIPSSTLPRWPRKDESMLSVNGSPLANPLTLDLNGWLSRVAEADSDTEHNTSTSTNGTDVRKGHKRTNSIIVRSTSQNNVHGANGLHSRTNSQSSLVFQSSQQSHSRLNSRENGFVPVRTLAGSSSTESSQSLAAVVAVPTKDGHMLEFNPFETTPNEIDALDGISDAAKKQAKQDIARLVMQAVERWKIA